MIIPFHQVDAFVVDGRPLTGNPAAVMPLDDWLPDATLQAIAAENNLSETAFLVRANGAVDWDLRWFTPTVEVDLCGHATLASAHVLIGDAPAISFATRSGTLRVTRAADRLYLDMPASRLEPAAPGGEAEALGQPVTGQWAIAGGNGGVIALLEDETSLRAARPDFSKVAQCSNGFIIATAPGDACDFASRVFCPTFGIDEDPVTGSAHAALTPFWADRLDKTQLSAFQASARGGQLDCRLEDDRVRAGGTCATIIEGEFTL